MANLDIPYFQNSNGNERIEIGAKKFMCIGSLPPFDHPHVFLEMGQKLQTICPYCSTKYVFNSNLGENECNPISAVFNKEIA